MSAKKIAGKTSRPRDPEQSQERILAAALREFAAKGLAGARVDQIARRARINKRMLYHYFGNKRDLFHAVMRRKITERQETTKTFSDEPTENLPLSFHATCRETDWVRLLIWESLQTAGNQIEDEAARQEAVRVSLADLRRRQNLGLLTPAFDERHLALAKLSLTMFPTAFPQLTRLITGKSPSDRQFQREYMLFLNSFAVAFHPPPVG
jgi:TetR/AcrR family transcriptional regulator